ncbi:hypothetical protein VZT92_025542 [Zoarces viviparus]|uniref:Uncharacterized protein n=1 Tax=Zoarces viviparus TaxID=48416 RepID=A0AAW1DX30_ZOAVI
MYRSLILEDALFIALRGRYSTRQADEEAERSDGEPVSIQTGEADTAIFEQHPVTMEMGKRLHGLSIGHR